MYIKAVSTELTVLFPTYLKGIKGSNKVVTGFFIISFKLTIQVSDHNRPDGHVCFTAVTLLLQ
jgi:hypothetical protein